MSVCLDIYHQRKPSGSNKSFERTSYTHAPLKHLSKLCPVKFKMEMYLGKLDKFKHLNKSVRFQFVALMNFGTFSIQN